MDEGSIILDYWTPAGTSLTDTDQMLGEVEKIIASLPDVASYSRRTGDQLGFFITEPNSGDYVIRLKPKGERRGVEEVTDDLRARIAAAQPAVHADFGQLLEDNIGDLAGGVPQPIDIKIYGEDQAVLQDRAQAAAAILQSVSGVEDVFNGLTVAGPKVTVRVIPEALPRFGVTAESLLNEVAPALGGTVAGNLRIRERLYDIRVFSRRTSDVSSLPLLPVQTPSGALVPLSQLATISTGTPEVEIHRENLRTYLGVTARLSGRSLGSAMSEIQGKLSRSLNLPAGMSLGFGGLYEQQQSSFKGLLGVLFGGLLLVAVVLLFEFGDWRAPLLTVIMALTVLTSVLGLADRDGHDAQHLELRRRDHDGRHRRGKGRLPDPRRARSCGAGFRSRGLGGGVAQARSGRDDDDLLDGLRARAARDRARGGLPAPAAARDRRHRRVHPVEPAHPPGPSVALLLARSACLPRPRSRRSAVLPEARP